MGLRVRAPLLLLICLLLVGAFASAPRAVAMTGNWNRAWGMGVNGGSAFGICTVAAECQAGTPGGLGGEMTGPVAVATDPRTGNVYVAGEDEDRVDEFDSSGNWIRSWGKGVNGGSAFGICTVAADCQAGTPGGLGGEMNYPAGIAVDATTGDVYAAERNNNRIQEFDSSGNWIRAWGKGVNGGSAFGICTVAANCSTGSPGTLGGEMMTPVGIATDAVGDVYVADESNNRIQEFDSSGNWIRAWGKGVDGGSAFGICTVAAECQAGPSGGLGGEMVNPYAVAVDAITSDVYLADEGNNRIQEFDSSGNWIRAWGKGVDGGSAFGICTVAADCQAGTPGGLGGEMNIPAGIATDAAGNVYVSEANNERVQEFDSSGNWIRAWGKGVDGGSAFGICTVAAECQAGTPGGMGGEMNTPEGLATNAAGDLYLADALNNRIQEFHDSAATDSPPTASISAPADDQTYALGEQVPTSFGCSEAPAGPGLASCIDSNGAGGSSGRLDTSTAGAHTYSVTAASKDGLSGSASIHYNVRAPAPTITISKPSANEVYLSGGNTFQAAYRCADAPGGPGIASCVGTVAYGQRFDTWDVGTHTFTVTATSRDGAIATVQVKYTVIGWTPAQGWGPPFGQGRATMTETALLKSTGYTTLFHAPTAGSAAVALYRVPKGAHLTRAVPTLIAGGRATFAKARAVKIRLKLTAAGKRLLTNAKQIKLTAKCTFTPAGEPPVVSIKTFVLKR